MCYELRLATKADAEQIVEIYKNSHNVKDHDYHSPIYLQSVNDYIDAGCPFYVAESEGKVLGFLLAFDHIRWCYVESIVVSNEARGKGIATALLNKVIADGSNYWKGVGLCFDTSDQMMDRWTLKNGLQGSDTLYWRERMFNPTPSAK